MSNPLAGLAAPQKLLIIAPEQFMSAVQPLVSHKSATGMPATAVSISSLKAFFGIPAGGFRDPGDDAEVVKLAIQYAHEKLQTGYVLLVGDSQNFPVRYWFSSPWGTAQYFNAQVKISAEPNGGFVQSDLYYANLYHHSGSYPKLTTSGFDYWDDGSPGYYNTGDGSYPQTAQNPNNVDGYPDLAVGRLPAADAPEVTAYVNKVIAYEANMIAVGEPVISFVHDKQYGSLDYTTGLAQNLVTAGFPAAGMNYFLMENYPNALSLAGFGNGLFVAFIAEDGGGDLLIGSSSNRSRWNAHKKIGKKSVTGPALIAFAGESAASSLWIAFVAYSVGGSGEIQLKSSLDGISWPLLVETKQYSKLTPALATMQSRLYMSFVTDDDSDQIVVTSSADGKTWTTPAPVPGQNSCAAPALASFQPLGSPTPLLWMAFITNDPTNKIFICSSSDGTNWSPIYQVSLGPAATAPAMIVFEGKLFLAYVAAGSYAVYVTSSSDGQTWSTPSQVSTGTSRATPSFAVFGGNLHIGIRGNTTAALSTSVLAPGATQVWSSFTELPYGSALAPAPFVSTAHTDLAAALGQSFYVSYIGHGGAGGWGHMELFSEADVLSGSWTTRPIVFAAACQTALFAANTPWGVTFNDTNGNSRGSFNVNNSAIPGVPGLVAYEGDPPTQSWGTGPGFTETAPANSLTGNWALPVSVPSPNVYNSTPLDCIGKTWVIGAAPGGAIAYFGVHDVAPPNTDIEMEQYLLTNYYNSATNVLARPGGSISASPVLGDIYLQAQRTYWNAHQHDATTPNLSDYHSIPRLYLGWLVFFGDPSLRLAPISTQCSEAVQFLQKVIADRGPLLPVAMYNSTKSQLEKCVADGFLAQSFVDSLLAAYAAMAANRSNPQRP